MEIRVQDPAVPGEMKADGSTEGKVSETAEISKEAESPKDVTAALETEKTKMKIVSGEALLEGAAQETKESQSQDKAEEPDRNKYSRDTASVSESVEIWKQEEWDKVWAEILTWSPSSGLSLEDELGQLGKIYQTLLSAILSHGTQGGAEDQTERLNLVLSQTLKKLIHTRFDELELLLNNFGSSGSITALRSAVYRNVTGNNLTEAELNQFFGNVYTDKGQGRLPESGIRVPVSEAGNENSMGIIYQPTSSGLVKNNPDYVENLMKETSTVIVDRSVSLKRKSGKAQGANLTISPMKTGRVYEKGDLETAQRFAAYMGRGGNLLKLAGITGKSEELWGFLAAIMTIKSQMFVSYLGVEKELSIDLREASDRMIDDLIQEMVKQPEMRYSGASAKKPVFDVKAIYKVFYHMMNLYQTKRDLNEAVNKGVRYAYQQFLKKKENSDNHREPEPFFTKEKKDPAEDFKEGKKLIERDWKEFSNLLNNCFSEIPQGVLILSPWGMLAEPENIVERSESSLSPAFLIGGGTVFAIVIIVLLLLMF